MRDRICPVLNFPTDNEGERRENKTRGNISRYTINYIKDLLNDKLVNTSASWNSFCVGGEKTCFVGITLCIQIYLITSFIFFRIHYIFSFILKH